MVILGSSDQDLCIRDHSGPNDSRKGAPETIIGLRAEGTCVKETLLCTIIGLRAEGACVKETLLCTNENQTPMCASRIAESSYTDCSCAEVLLHCYNATAERSAVDRTPQHFPRCSASRSALMSCIPFQSSHSDYCNAGSDILR
jgi:hypothetical protein